LLDRVGPLAVNSARNLLGGRMKSLIAALVLSTMALPAVAAGPNGAAIYQGNCAACHQPQGQGMAGAFPALSRSKIVNGPPALSINQVLHGKNAMPPFGDSLKDPEIAAVLTYVRASWGNKAPAITPAQVAALRKKK
jgi:mono/diheme cytochrome c family protein